MKVRERRGGSLTRRMIVVAAIWIGVLLLIGGYALDRVLSRGIVQNFDQQLEYVLNAMIGASEIGPDGEVRFTRPPADQRFLEPYSGAYFQISGQGQETFPSRSLWDRRLKVDADHNDVELHKRDSFEFEGEPLRILERDVVLPGSNVRWRFQVAQSREAIDGQIQRPALDPGAELRRARARPAGAGRAAGDLRPVAAAPGAAGGRRDPRRRPDPHRRGFPARGRAAGRRDQRAAGA